MPRPPKKTNYNPDALLQQLISEVSEAYLSPSTEHADANGHMQLNALAEEFSMTTIKIRKLLVTAGIYESPTGKRVMELKQQGKSVKEIMQITGLSAASVSGYLPYQKTAYKLSDNSVLAKRLQRYRNRKKAVEKLKNAIAGKVHIEVVKEYLWDALRLFEGYGFYTATGVRFYYIVKENDIIFSRMEQPVKRSTVEMALEEALGLQKKGIGGSKLENYLYPVFVKLGGIL